MDATQVQERYEAASPQMRQMIDRLLQQDADDLAWAEQIGPVFRQSDVALLLGKSKQAVSADDGLLRLEMRSGTVGYPAFQFDGRTLVAGVRDVVRILTPAVATPWTAASWLTSPHAGLDGVGPIDALRAGRVDDVVTLARRTATRMLA